MGGFFKQIAKPFEKHLIKPTFDSLRDAVNVISDVTKPASDVITKKIAPVLKKVVEVSTNIATAPTEMLIKGTAHVAGALGDKEMQAKLNKNADDLNRAGKQVSEASGQIVTAKNAIQVAASVGGTVACGGNPICGAVALSAVQSAQGQTVTGTDILLNVGASYVGGLASSGVGNQVVAGAINGATRDTTKVVLSKVANSEDLSWNEIRDAASKGAITGAASAGIDSKLSDTSPPIVNEVLKGGVVGAVDSTVTQYQATGNVNIGESTAAFGAGAINSGFSGAVQRGVDIALSEMADPSSEHAEISEQESEDDSDEFIASDEDNNEEEMVYQNEAIYSDEEAYKNIEPITEEPKASVQMNIQELKQLYKKLGKKGQKLVTKHFADYVGEKIEDQYEKSKRVVELKAAKVAKKEFIKQAKKEGKRVTRKEIEAVRHAAQHEAGKQYIQSGGKIANYAKLLINNAKNIITLIIADDKQEAIKKLILEKTTDVISKSTANMLSKKIIDLGAKKLGSLISNFGATGISAILDSESAGEQDKYKLVEGVYCDTHDKCIDSNGNIVQTNSASSGKLGWFPMASMMGAVKKIINKVMAPSISAEQVTKVTHEIFQDKPATIVGLASTYSTSMIQNNLMHITDGISYEKQNFPHNAQAAVTGSDSIFATAAFFGALLYNQRLKKPLSEKEVIIRHASYTKKLEEFCNEIEDLANHPISKFQEYFDAQAYLQQTAILFDKEYYVEKSTSLASSSHQLRKSVTVGADRIVSQQLSRAEDKMEKLQKVRIAIEHEQFQLQFSKKGFCR